MNSGQLREPTLGGPKSSTGAYQNVIPGSCEIQWYWRTHQLGGGAVVVVGRVGVAVVDRSKVVLHHCCGGENDTL